MKVEDGVAYFNLSADCEATQPAVNDPSLGERATRGLAEVLEGERGSTLLTAPSTSRGWRGTFFVIPTDVEAHASLYRELVERGHEVGLHLHPAAQGYAEFLGIYGPETQEKVILEAADRFAAAMGFRPRGFCMGYGSANDYTYPILVKLGFTHGMCSVPGRILPECASVWAGAPLFMHYAHAYNRVLIGDLDFVEAPNTVDWESRMWGGKHPQDLRVELVDAKNHFYTIEKAFRRQVEEEAPVKLIHAATHNIFEYGDPKDFRRQTLEGIVTHFKNIVGGGGFRPVGTTLEEAAGLFRQRVDRESEELKLDRRGYLK